MDFTIRLNPPVKSIILRGEPIIFRSCSKRQRVAADHLKRCSSIIRQYGYSDRHLTSNTLAANPFLISLLVLFQDGIFDITALSQLSYSLKRRGREGSNFRPPAPQANRRIAVTVFFNGKGCMEQKAIRAYHFLYLTYIL